MILRVEEIQNWKGQVLLILKSSMKLAQHDTLLVQDVYGLP